jgi:hypothetical protein
MLRRFIPQAFMNRLLLAFPGLYSRLRYESQLTPDQVAILERLLSQGLPGDVIECGVYRAGTTVLLARYLKRHRIAKTIYALDSFGGFDVAGELNDDIRRGMVVPVGRTAFTYNSVGYVRAKLERLGVASLVEVVPGYFENTLPRIDAKFCLALVDCDLEKSVEFCLTHLWERIVPGGYLVVDDYANPGYPGARIAADRFADHAMPAERWASHNFLVLKK